MARSSLVPIYVVSKKEFRTNLLSVRMAILTSIFALAVVGASYGFSGLTVTPSVQEQFVLFVHPTFTDSQMGVTAFVSDAWGVPHANQEVQLYRNDPSTGAEVLVGTSATDEDGYVRFPDLAEGSYTVTANFGIASWGYGVTLDPRFYEQNLSYVWEQFDLDDSGVQDDLVIHFLDRSGQVPQGVDISLEGEALGSPDARGFFSVKLREGTNNMTVTYGEEVHEMEFFVFSLPGGLDPLSQGPDGVLLFVALIFGSFLLPIVAIALSYDSIAKEKAQGSADLLLYRPASWRSIAVGKVLGVFGALAVPVTTVNLAGIFVVTAVTGRWPDALFSVGFFGTSLFLIAVYVLLMVALSTVAKTAGTAILFGVVLWLTFNLLWNAVFFIVSLLAGLSPASREYFVLAAYLGLLNPNSLYQSLLALMTPAGVTLFGLSVDTFALPWWAAPIAAVAWIVVPLFLFLEVFQRKASA